jgi:hypothetical protein
MGTIANTTTTEAAILNQIVKELRTITGMNEYTVFVCAIPLFLEAPPGDTYIEVVPGAAIDLQAKQGTGRLQDGFTVCVFRRLFTDQEGRDTERIANASLGILATVAAIEQKLIASYCKGLALVPVLPERREACERNPQDPADGWVMMKRAFRVEYLYSFPAAQSTS